jgi:hypothetical protein
VRRNSGPRYAYVRLAFEAKLKLAIFVGNIGICREGSLNQRMRVAKLHRGSLGLHPDGSYCRRLTNVSRDIAIRDPNFRLLVLATPAGKHSDLECGATFF